LLECDDLSLHKQDVNHILIQPGDGLAPDAADMKRSLGIVADLAIPAVEHGRIGRISDPLALLPSTRLVEVAEQMEHMLAAWAKK